MASIQRYTVGGRAYWRIVESRRINGKPRAIPIMHLGTAENIFNRLESGVASEAIIKSFTHGNILALKEIAEETDLINIIDRCSSKSKRKVSIGTSLLVL